MEADNKNNVQTKVIENFNLYIKENTILPHTARKTTTRT